MTRLVELGIVKKYPSSEWASSTLIIPTSNQTDRFNSNFREVNKRIIQTMFPIPTSQTTKSLLVVVIYNSVVGFCICDVHIFRIVQGLGTLSIG